MVLACAASNAAKKSEKGARNTRGANEKFSRSCSKRSERAKSYLRKSNQDFARSGGAVKQTTPGFGS